jgi:hypothetical protein
VPNPSSGSRGRNAIKNEALTRALDQALAGNPRPLYSELARLSGLPGPRANMGVLDAFADECALRGERADGLLIALAKLDADHAPGATPLEFLPMCGVAGLGARASLDARARPQLLSVLHESAEDFRFRVREVVPTALARVGAATGDELVPLMQEWTNGFFHAAAVLRALSSPEWSVKLTKAAPVIARMDEAFALATDAPRATQRYPGWKALVDALAIAPGKLAGRFGVAVFDMLVRWSTVKEPALREVIEKNLQDPRLVGRHNPEIERVHAALTAALPPVRNPDHYVGPTRGRGRKRGR